MMPAIINLYTQKRDKCLVDKLYHTGDTSIKLCYDNDPTKQVLQ